MPRGLVVGAIPGFAFETARVRLAPGEALVLFSDGVTEARSPSGELFGQARLLATLEAQGELAAVERVAGIRDAVLAHGAGSRPTDDFTVLVVGRSPCAPASAAAADSEG